MKTNLISRTWRGTMAIAMALTTAGSMMSAVPTMAAGSKADTANITINKKDGLNFNDFVPNTGESMSDDDIGKLPYVNDVGFTVYDVSDYFYGEFDGKNHDDLYKGLQDNWEKIYADNEDAIKVAKTEQMTAGEGKTTFTDLPTKVTYNGATRNAVYVIIETTHSKEMAPSRPMVVALPAYKSDGTTENKDIQLYPKNYGVDKVLLDDKDQPLKEEGNVYDYEVGKVLTYEVKFAIPSDIGHTKANGTDSLYNKFSISDAMTTVGATFEGIQSMDIAGTDVLAELGEGARGVIFTPSASDDTSKPASWQLDYAITDAAMRNTLAEYAGKTMVIRYQVKINEAAVPNKDINNQLNVTLDRDGNPIEQKDDGPNVTTRGVKFKKVDSQTNDGLGEAEFYIRNSDGEYAKFENDNWENPKSIAWKATKEEATKIETPQSGEITIIGLDSGSYTLIEEAPPKDYMEPLNPETKFEVNKDSFTLTELSYIKNTKENPGTLPMTGGIGIITLIVIGGTMMGASALKKKED